MTKQGGANQAQTTRQPSATSCVPVEATVRNRLGVRSVVLVGLMGAGKSTVGRRLAARLDLPFKDADAEIEAAAGMSVADIFATHGEAYFREGERRVIGRLLQEGSSVLATGGGAFMNPETRAWIAQSGVSIWLKAEFEVLMKRVRKRSNRPLLKNPDPESSMRQLMAARQPVYALADLTVESRDIPHERVVDDALQAIHAWLSAEGRDT
jgi:shikimate kinase